MRIGFDDQICRKLTPLTMNSNGIIIWSIILVVERFIIQNRIYNMNLYHH